MKSKILFLVALLFGLFNYAMAQCPPWNTPASFAVCKGDVVPAVNLPIGSMSKVLIVGAPSITNGNNDVKAKLDATGAFSQVDTFNAQIATPTLALLQAYGAVLVYSDFPFNDPIALGNNLAAYIDGGGGVVTTMFATGIFSYLPNGHIQGNFATNTYRVIIPADESYGTIHSLGTVHLPSHPTMTGVTNFNGGNGSYRPTSTTLTPGSYRVADWNDGSFLITAKDNVGTAMAKRVDLGFYPPSSDIWSDLWQSSTDGAKIMANALTYVSSGYNWTNSNTAIGLAASGTGNIPSFTATNTTNAPISGTITVTLKNPPAGCTDTVRSYTITVNPKPIVSVSQPAPVCEPNTIDLSNTVNANIQVNYTFHNADYSPRSNSVSTVADSQKFYVIGTTSSGCSDTETVYVTINPKPVVVTHNPTAQCAPSTVNLTLPAVTAGSTAGLTYTYWLNAAATQPVSSATAVTNTGSKLYYLVGTTNKGCTDTTNVMVTFYNKPNVVAYNPPAACTGSSVNIKTAATTYGSTANLTYTYWNSANQNITATANAITVGGSYSIVGANSAGCKDTATVTVTFNNCGGIMSGNNGNQSNNEVEQNGLGKLQQILVKLYPNPASNVLYFEYEAYQNGTVASFITDATGRTVRQQQFQSNSAGVQKFDVDVQSLPAGMYYFHFQLPESKENKTIKFVINK